MCVCVYSYRIPFHFCPQCGTKLQSDFKFCPSCGLRLPCLDDTPVAVGMTASLGLSPPEKNKPPVAKTSLALGSNLELVEGKSNYFCNVFHAQCSVLPKLCVFINLRKSLTVSQAKPAPHPFRLQLALHCKRPETPLVWQSLALTPWLHPVSPPVVVPRKSRVKVIKWVWRQYGFVVFRDPGHAVAWMLITVLIQTFI